MAGAEAHHHRSSLKQSNKPFKSKHASKGSLKASSKGKVERGPVKSVKQRNSTKADRRNAAKLEQQKKREELRELTRLFTGPSAPPKIVAVVPLCPDVDPIQVIKDLHVCLDLDDSNITNGPVTLPVNRFKQKLQLIPTTRETLSVLDTTQIADFIIFVMSAEIEVDEHGTQLLSLIKSMGVPQPMGVVQHLQKQTAKMQPLIRKSLTSYMDVHFPGMDPKLFETGLGQEAIGLLRNVTSLRPRGVGWRDKHAYMVADGLEYVPGTQEEENGTLKVT
ncbi:hypothetical protein HDV05_000421, partial [Chytridiales sp. JEL 0842]